MQTFKNNSKYFIVAALTLSIVGGVFAQVTIPTGLTNAIQYIRETVWTSNGTDTGLVNVKIGTGNIYIRTGFLSNGTGWNNRALGVDGSGNVVYVDANGLNQFLFPAANYIPKINSTQNGLEMSSMYQDIGGMIGINNTNPVKSLDILGNFQVMTPGSTQTYQYIFLQAIATSSPLSIVSGDRCACDTSDPTPYTVSCGSVETAQLGNPPFCIDITGEDPNTPGNVFYNMHILNTIGTPDPVLVTLGTNVGIGTSTPEAELHVVGTTYTQGAIRRNVKIITSSPYDVQDDDHILMYLIGGGGLTINANSNCITDSIEEGRELVILSVSNTFVFNTPGNPSAYDRSTPPPNFPAYTLICTPPFGRMPIQIPY